MITIKPIIRNISSHTAAAVETRNLSLSYCNVGSLKNKTTSIYDFITHDSVDIMLISETWLLPEDDENTVYLNELVPSGYSITHAPRSNGQTGGGVGIISHNALTITFNRSSFKPKGRKFNQFEYLDCTVAYGKDQQSRFRLVVVYRPPPTAANKLRLSSFWIEWDVFLASFSTSSIELAIVGDLNFHVDLPEKSSSRKFESLLVENNLVQHIKCPTHSAGHTLDVLITRPESRFSHSDIKVHDPGFCNPSGIITLSYHLAISWSYPCIKPKHPAKLISYRKLENICHDTFIKDFQETNLSVMLNSCKNVDDMVSTFSEVTLKLVDKHAPVLTKTIIDRPSTRWYTPSLNVQKRQKQSSQTSGFFRNSGFFAFT